MTQSTVFLSRYEKRVKLVQDILREETKLSEEQSRVLAIRLVHKLDTIPEPVR